MLTMFFSVQAFQRHWCVLSSQSTVRHFPWKSTQEPQVSLVSENTCCSTWLAKKWLTLQPSDVHLYMYPGELIKVLGTIWVTVCYKDQVKQLSLLVIPTDGPSLLGQDWLHTITLDWKQLNHFDHVHHRALQDVLDLYVDLFKPKIGTLQGTIVRFTSSWMLAPAFLYQTRFVHPLQQSHCRTQQTMQGRRYWAITVFWLASTHRANAQEWCFHPTLQWLQADRQSKCNSWQVSSAKSQWSSSIIGRRLII